MTCSVKTFRADEVEEAVLNYLHQVVEIEGYFLGIERKLESFRGNSVSMLEVRRRKLEQTISKAEKDIKCLIQMQIDANGDPALRDIYGDQLKDLKAGKDADIKVLSEVSSQLSQGPDAKIQLTTIQQHLKQLRAAWDKASPALQKRLLRMLFQRLVLHPAAIDIFYRTESDGTIYGQTNGDSEPADLSRRAVAGDKLSQEGSNAHPSNLLHLEKKKPLDRLAHKAKVQGSYNIRIGSGDRI